MARICIDLLLLLTGYKEGSVSIALFADGPNENISLSDYSLANIARQGGLIYLFFYLNTSVFI